MTTTTITTGATTGTGTTPLRYAARDSMTMLRRNLRHMLRYPSMTLLLVGMPVIFLLLFVYVFGGTMGAGLGGTSGGRSEYANYVAPGIILMAVTAVANGTAVAVAMDMTEGIVARFRTMAIFRPAVLTGHVVGAVIQTLLAVTIVTGVALLVGFRPNATPLEWLAAIGLLTLFALALTWLAVGLGLFCKTVESASNAPMPLTLLPFIGSGFVPADSMPAGLRWFAEYQPLTPVIETLRGLLLGTPIGHDAAVAIAWCAGISVVCILWAKKLYNRDPAAR